MNLNAVFDQLRWNGRPYAVLAWVVATIATGLICTKAILTGRIQIAGEQIDRSANPAAFKKYLLVYATCFLVAVAILILILRKHTLFQSVEDFYLAPL